MRPSSGDLPATGPFEGGAPSCPNSGSSDTGGWIDEDVGVVEGPFVPSGFVVPLALATEEFRLEPLGPQHNDSDYAAWSSSVEHIHMTPGWETSSWPDDRSVVDNLRDLRAHADDFENRAGFTYTVLDPATDDVIGCVYIYPDESEQHDARVLSWVWRAGPSSTCSCGARSRTGSRTSGRLSVWLTPSAPTAPDATALSRLRVALG